jgi:hypothetical protein
MKVEFEIGPMQKKSKTMPKVLALLCALSLVLSTSALANDSSAVLAAGGLVLTKSDAIEMRSEDLFISTEEVRVRYDFFNHSDRDVTTQIAFPMPDIPYGIPDNYALPTHDPLHILNFTTRVNGRPVAIMVERKAVLDGVDRTEILRRLGVPLAPRFEQKYNDISQATWDQLVRLGLIEDTPRTDGLMPRWTLKTTYYWEQTFPAHQDVIIDHRYQPSVGGVVPMPISYLLNDLSQTRALSRFCVDQAILNALTRSSTSWEQRTLEYVLLTGANWSGPIAKFRLVLDKGSPANLVSFCGQGVRKIGPTQFEMRATEFVPTSNLSVLILRPFHERAADIPRPRGSIDPRNILARSCDQLWYQRNSIFKAAGYCFHSPRGIRTFGNAGCRYDNQGDVFLSDSDRQAINMIQEVERTKRCP